MISIIVPVYNSEKFLRDCISSILSQTYEDFELILLNDGSTDKSGEICKKYAKIDNRIVYIEKENGGVGETRNLGLEIARGEWVCFIDSDDEVSSDYLKAFNTNNSDADLIYSGIDRIDIASRKSLGRIEFTPLSFDPIEKPLLLRDLLTIGFPFGKAYKKCIIDENDLKFPSDISFHEDHVFVFDYLLHSKKIQTITDITYYYKIDLQRSSLSKMHHNWRLLYRSSQYMMNRLNRIKDKFSISMKDMQDIYTFCYEPIISAIYSIPDEELSYKEGKTIINQLLNTDLKIRELYFPKSIKGKLIKNIYKHLPMFVTYGYLIGISKYKKFRYR